MLRRFISSSRPALGKVYVGNLPWTANEDTLRDSFSKFGGISDCFVVRDRASGRSKGFGFIEFQTEEATQEAIKEMNEFSLQGRNLRVDNATEKTRTD